MNMLRIYMYSRYIEYAVGVQ